MTDIKLPDGIDLVKFVQAVYALSRPQGMGFMHYKPGDLSETDAKTILAEERPNDRVALRLDYVGGRSCKMTVFRKDGGLYIRSAWLDHSDADMAELLRRVTPELV